MTSPRLLALLLCLACGGTQTATVTPGDPAPVAQEEEAATRAPHLTAFSPGAPYQVYFDIDRMKSSPWSEHYSRLTGYGFGVHWARLDATQLAFAFNSDSDFVAVVRPTGEGGTSLAEHELSEGVWANRPVEGQRADQCERDFEDVTLWLHTKGAAMVEAGRLMRGQYGFHPNDLTMTLDEADDGLRLSLRGNVRPMDESEAAQQRNLAKAEQDIRQLYTELFGDGPLELDLQLGASEWRATVIATDEAGVTQLMKGALAFTKLGRDPEPATLEQSAELLCTTSADTYAQGGQSALMAAWTEATWNTEAQHLLCALNGASTESQPVLMRAFAARNGTDECRLADLLAQSQERLEVDRSLCD